MGKVTLRMQRAVGIPWEPGTGWRSRGTEEQRSRGAELPFAHWPMWKWTLEEATGSRGRAPAASEQVCAAAGGGGWWWEPLAKDWGGPVVGLK